LRLLPDTHLLIWAAEESSKLPKEAADLIGRLENNRFFSAASIWEIAIKRGLGRADFLINPDELRLELLANGYVELSVTGVHGAAVAGLPMLHRDPFDRILVAQAMIEGVTLLTVDPVVAGYPGDVRLV
jgi:PIN domain nuclease of toxin-antitoxin system